MNLKESELREVYRAVESVYQVRDVEGWLDRLSGELVTLTRLEEQLSMLYDLPDSRPDSPVGVPLKVATRGEVAEGLYAITRRLILSPTERDEAFREALARCFRGRPAFEAATFGSEDFYANSAFGRALEEAGVVDQAILAATDGGAPSLLSVGLKRDEAVDVDRAIQKLLLLAPHISAAARIVRRRLTSSQFEPDVLLTPTGKLLDARGEPIDAESREQLREAVMKAERARLRRLGPEEALELRVALVSGRWTLIDEFDTDGSRHWLAIENAPQAPGGPATLTPRQRTVLHLLGRGYDDDDIAAELGISPATVEVHIRNAAGRLGVTGRRGLLAALVRPEAYTPQASMGEGGDEAARD